MLGSIEVTHGLSIGTTTFDYQQKLQGLLFVSSCICNISFTFNVYHVETKAEVYVILNDNSNVSFCFDYS